MEGRIAETGYNATKCGRDIKKRRLVVKLLAVGILLREGWGGGEGVFVSPLHLRRLCRRTCTYLSISFQGLHMF